MPPDGFDCITVKSRVTQKLVKIMSETECDSYAEAVEHAADLALEDLG